MPIYKPALTSRKNHTIKNFCSLPPATVLLPNYIQHNEAKDLAKDSEFRLNLKFRPHFFD